MCESLKEYVCINFDNYKDTKFPLSRDKDIAKLATDWWKKSNHFVIDNNDIDIINDEMVALFPNCTRKRRHLTIAVKYQ